MGVTGSLDDDAGQLSRLRKPLEYRQLGKRGQRLRALAQQALV